METGLYSSVNFLKFYILTHIKTSFIWALFLITWLFHLSLGYSADLRALWVEMGLSLFS